MQPAVRGPLIVMRVRAAKASDSMGTKVVSVLNRYLKYTQSQQIQWQHRTASGGQDPWQLFEVIGDFGSNDQTEVMQKLSDLAKHRFAYPLVWQAAAQVHANCRLHPSLDTMT